MALGGEIQAPALHGTAVALHLCKLGQHLGLCQVLSREEYPAPIKKKLCLSPWSCAQLLFIPKDFVCAKEKRRNESLRREQSSREMHKTQIFGYIQLNTYTHVCRHVYEEHIYHLLYLANSKNL